MGNEAQVCHQRLEDNREDLTVFPAFPLVIRTIIYTTSVIGNLGEKIGKPTNSELSRSGGEAFLKLVFPADLEVTNPCALAVGDRT